MVPCHPISLSLSLSLSFSPLSLSLSRAARFPHIPSIIRAIDKTELVPPEIPHRRRHRRSKFFFLCSALRCRALRCRARRKVKARWTIGKNWSASAECDVSPVRTEFQSGKVSVQNFSGGNAQCQNSSPFFFCFSKGHQCYCQIVKVMVKVSPMKRLISSPLK